MMRIGFMTMAAVLGMVVLLGIAVAQPTEPPSGEQEIIKFLDQTLDWYHRVTAVNDTPINSAEVLLRETVRQNARHALRLGFDFAQAEATVLAAETPSTQAAASGGGGGNSRGRNLAQAAATANQRVVNLRSQLDELDRQIGVASPTSRPVLDARRDKLVAQLDLAQARRSVLTNLASFTSGADGSGAAGLAAKVAELRQSAPEVLPDVASPAATEAAATPATQPSAATTAAVAAAAAAGSSQAIQRQSASILGLAGEMITLSRRTHELKELADHAEALRLENDKLRAPIRTQLQDAIHKSDALGATADSDDPAKLQADRQEIEKLTARFRQITSMSVPLGEQGTMLTATRDELLEWQGTLAREYNTILRHVIVRLIATGAAVIVVLLISTLWRRATLRYVQDVRRRRQLMLVRRIVVGVILLIVALAAFVTEIGSLATFAGIITAGLAVALQTFILSGAAYFFFIGRYGVRVGDRVTVGGITGEVVETGLFRLYLMELGGADKLRATGRVVVFSNSVLFQPGGFYKQLPGADYVYHEVALTLSPESDHHLAEQRLMAAVEEVYGEYKDEIERQYAEATRGPAAGHLPLPRPRPEGRLRFVDSGLEFIVRYPVELAHAAEVDDRITRKLLGAIEREPKLKLVAAGTPKIQPAG
jgi:small-conductance mechanosensitive channel